MVSVYVSNLVLDRSTLGQRFTFFSNGVKKFAVDFLEEDSEKIVNLLGKNNIEFSHPINGLIKDGVFYTDDESFVRDLSLKDTLSALAKMYATDIKKLLGEESIIGGMSSAMLVNGDIRNAYINFIQASKDVSGTYSNVSGKVSQGGVGFSKILSGGALDGLRVAYNYLNIIGSEYCDCRIFDIPVRDKNFPTHKFTLNSKCSFGEFSNQFKEYIKSENFMGSVGKCYIKYNGIRYDVSLHVGVGNL